MTATLDPVTEHFQNYAHYHEHLRIEDRATQVVVPLRLNVIQRRIHNRIAAALAEERPVRLVILKARREGVSTYVQSLFATDAFTRRQVHALTVSHEEKSTRTLHEMTERMYDHLPEKIRPRQKSGIRGKRLELTHGSSIEVATAGGDGEVGRSGGFSRLHLSELAQYPNAGITWQGVVPTIPEEPGTVIIVESTPKGRVGRGKFFFDLWQLACEPQSVWEALFFGWQDFPDYVAPVPFDFALSDEEETLRERFSLSLEQLAWRRHTIETYFRDNPEQFVEEYPATPEEAFLHSGRPFFLPLLVQRMAGMAEKRVPVFRGELGSVGVYPERGATASPHPIPTGRLRVLKPPEDGHRYVLALDPAGVLTAREFEAFTDRSNARDYCAMLVVDRYTRHAVAYWHSRFDLGLVGFEAAKLGKLYKNALCVVEMTGGYGAAPLDTLRKLGYSPLYSRVKLDHERQPISEELGWMTSTANRSRILEGLRDLLREDPAALAIPELAREMDAFVEGDSGTPAAAPGEHDDLVMAAAIAFEVVREYPQTLLLEEAA